MKRLRNRAHRDGGYIDSYFLPVGFLLMAACVAFFAIGLHNALPATNYVRICGDERTYTRVSVDRCFDSKVGAEWLYIEEGHRLPKMGGDVSDTSTRTHGRTNVRTADR